MEIEHGDPDGLGRVRTITFDAASTDAIKKAWKVLRDPRVASSRVYRKRLTVHFVNDTRADRRDPFPLESVMAVLDGPTED